MPTLAQSAEALLHGFSISPTGKKAGTVVDHMGGVWGVFDGHKEAVIAVEAYRRGFALGREIGHTEGMEEVAAKMRDALGVKKT
jgi:hypothetical protein